jgi:predicted nucleotidyltransferase
MDFSGKIILTKEEKRRQEGKKLIQFKANDNSQTTITEQINIIVSTIISNLSPEKIILFGSHGYGKPLKDSDIDILVIVHEHKQPRYKRARDIRKHLWGKVQIPKDILIYTVDEIKEWKNVESAFITSILNKGKILYEREK